MQFNCIKDYNFLLRQKRQKLLALFLHWNCYFKFTFNAVISDRIDLPQHPSTIQIRLIMWTNFFDL